MGPRGVRGKQGEHHQLPGHMALGSGGRARVQVPAWSPSLRTAQEASDPMLQRVGQLWLR